MNHLTASAATAADLGFVLMLDENGLKLSESINKRLNAKQLALIGMVQARIQNGEKEFELNENGLRISVVPIDLEGEKLVGYVAVASL